MEAASIQTQTSATVDLLQNYSQKLILDNINHIFLYSVISLGVIIDDINKRKVTIQTPIDKTGLQVSFDMTEFNSSYALKWEKHF